jgi:multiple antibiotic resistance protein
MLEQLLELSKVIPWVITALFPVINPIGTSLIFMNLTDEADSRLRRSIAKKIAANSFILMMSMLIFGAAVLSFFGISVPIIQFCGGLVILSMGWKMLNNPDEDKLNENKESMVKSEISIGTMYRNKAFYPFTFPLTVGPGTFAVTLTLSAELTKTKGLVNNISHYTAAFIAIVILSFSIYFLYGYTDKLAGVLSTNMRRVSLRIISFIMFCIGGEIAWHGLQLLIAPYFN